MKCAPPRRLRQLESTTTRGIRRNVGHAELALPPPRRSTYAIVASELDREFLDEITLVVPRRRGAFLRRGARPPTPARSIRSRRADRSICGSNPGLAGFGLPDDQGVWKGLDVDECRAIAAAIFNDPNKVKFLPINAKDRPTILASGEIDVLIRNTTWTLSRETAGMFFTGVNFYDGQGFMVRKKLGVDSALKLDGASVCIQQGTTTELNARRFLSAPTT